MDTIFFNHFVIWFPCFTGINTSEQLYLQVEGNSNGHMMYVCLCSPVNMMVSPRLLFTQQYCSYSEGGRSSLLSHDDTARVDCTLQQRRETRIR